LEPDASPAKAAPLHNKMQLMERIPIQLIWRAEVVGMTNSVLCSE
jgi:hypothetical protein